MTTRTRAVAAGAAALAVVTAASGTALAGTASAPAATALRGQTSSAVLSLTLSTPTLATLGLGDPVTLSLLGTQGGASKDLATSVTSTAASTLASGSVVDALLTGLGQSTVATSASPNPADKSAAAVPANPLGLAAGAGTLKAKVDALTGGSSSSGQLSGLSVGSLAALPGGAALVAPLQTALGGVVTTVTGALGNIDIPALTSVLPTVPALSIPNPLGTLLPGTPATVSLPAVSVTDLTTALAALPATVQALVDQILNGKLVDITAVDGAQAVTPGTSGVVSSALAHAGTVSLLGGTIQVSGLTSNAIAAATGKPGGASADATAGLVTAKLTSGAGSKLGDLVTLAVNSQGLVASVAAAPRLDATVKQQVAALGAQLNGLLTQLNGLLDLLGVKVAQSTTTKTVSPDGTHAESHASGALVSLSLPTQVAPLVALRLGASNASADYAAVPAAQPATPATTTATPTRTTPKATPTAPAPLAYTGASVGLPLAGLALLGLGVVLRRRRVSQV